MWDNPSTRSTFMKSIKKNLSFMRWMQNVCRNKDSLPRPRLSSSPSFLSVWMIPEKIEKSFKRRRRELASYVEWNHHQAGKQHILTRPIYWETDRQTDRPLVPQAERTYVHLFFIPLSVCLRRRQAYVVGVRAQAVVCTLSACAHKVWFFFLSLVCLNLGRLRELTTRAHENLLLSLSGCLATVPRAPLAMAGHS